MAEIPNDIYLEVALHRFMQNAHVQPWNDLAKSYLYNEVHDMKQVTLTMLTKLRMQKKPICTH